LQERGTLFTPLTDPEGLTPTRATWRPAVIPVVAAGVVAIDQLTKSWALSHLKDRSDHVVGPVKLILTFNSGAAFNLGTGVTPIVETVVVVLVVVLVLFSRRASRRASLLTSIGLGLLLGGAVGNLADRVFRHHHGAVVDFIQAAGWWPIFNLADASIVGGMLAVGLSSWMESGRSDARA
jgi:signal peptidase II